MVLSRRCLQNADPDILLAGHPCDTVTINLYSLDVRNQVLQPCKGMLPQSSGLLNAVQSDATTSVTVQMETLRSYESLNIRHHPTRQKNQESINNIHNENIKTYTLYCRNKCEQQS